MKIFLFFIPSPAPRRPMPNKNFFTCSDGSMAPPPSLTPERLVHVCTKAPGAEPAGAGLGMGRQPQKCNMSKGFGDEIGCWRKCNTENGKLQNCKLEEAHLCKGGHVVHMCHPVRQLRRGGGLVPRGPPIDPSTHRSN